MSDKRDSNPRPSAWEADALPTELLSHWLCKVKEKVGIAKINSITLQFKSQYPIPLFIKVSKIRF